MVKDLDKKLAKMVRQQERLEMKIERLKTRHAHALMNEARELLGKSPKRFGTRKPRRANKVKGPTFSKGAAGK